MLNFFAQIVHVRPALVVSPLFQDAQRHLDSGDGRAELMGDIAQKAFLADDEAGEPRRHAIDGLAEQPELIAAPLLHASIKAAFGNLAGGLSHLANGAGQRADEGKPEQAGKDHGAQTDGQPGFEVEKQAPALKVLETTARVRGMGRGMPGPRTPTRTSTQ